ncbi:hypothetical protein VNO78_11188 [Psophocarpus tetragonolobus]|uniref:Uncharacterized protein n=1 Tax=Psophocarpus tetragonolobus TaxID=3891 RepID=A0AAN9SNH3_PSOTE
MVCYSLVFKDSKLCTSLAMFNHDSMIHTLAIAYANIFVHENSFRISEGKRLRIRSRLIFQGGTSSI